MKTMHFDADTTFVPALCGARNPEGLTCNEDRVNCADCKRILAELDAEIETGNNVDNNDE